MKLQQEDSELENVRDTQLFSQYVVLEDKLIAGIEMFENRILRPSEKEQLSRYVEELDKLTKGYQDEWDDDYWRIYRFRRGINTELSLLELPRRNQLSVKIQNFRTGGAIKLSGLEPSTLSTDSFVSHDLSSIVVKPPANSAISFVDKKPPPPANSTISAPGQSPDPSNISIEEPSQFISTVSVSEHSPVVSETQAPMPTLKNQSATVIKPAAKKPTVQTDSGPTCCAGCIIS